jgi:plastocyanin
MTRGSLAVAVCILLAGCGQQAVTSPDDHEAAQGSIVVQITNMSVMPAVARVKAGGMVSWSNMSDFLASVVLPMADASAFDCKELRPDFVRTDTGIESLPMRSENLRVMLPCALKPGRYPYQIKLAQGVQTVDIPTAVLDAQILVE